MWIDQNNNVSRPTEDIEAKMMALQGELTDEQSKATLAEFLYHNPAFMMDLIAGIKMFPMQELIIKGWMRTDYNLGVWGRGVSKCIDQESEVITQNGFVKIKDVQIGDMIYADQAEQKVLNKWVNPEEDGFMVTSKRGYSFTAKRGHKVKVFDPETLEFSFKNVEDLTGLETLPIHTGASSRSTQDMVAGYKNECRTHEKPMVQPEDSNDLFYLMGVILGDGCITSGREVKITSADREMIDFCNAYLSKLLPDSHVNVIHKEGQSASDVYVGSRPLIRFLEYMGFDYTKKAHQKEIPQRVLMSSGERIAAFLSGLFDTDGYCSFKQLKTKAITKVGFTSSSRKLSDQVHWLLLSYGIVSSMCVVHKAGPAVIMGIKCNTQEARGVAMGGREDVEKFQQRIGFRLKRKADTLRLCIESGNSQVSYPVGRYLKKKYKRYHFRKHGGMIPHRSIGGPNLDRMIALGLFDEIDLAKINAVRSSPYFFDPIKSIVPTKTTTVDITVDKEECYWSRGFVHHNSWSVALFCLIWAIFKPKNKIVVVSFSFRASRRILKQCEKFVADDDAIMLKNCLPDGMKRSTDEWLWELPNGSTITCLPLGDGTKIRGIRADTLIVDEFAYLPETIIGEVLRPFLTANNRIKEQRTVQEREDKMIAAGVMTEAERTLIEDNKKVIFLSSASFKFQHLYKRYCDWVSLIEKPEKKEEMNKSGVTYFVSRLSYDAAPEGLLNLKEIEEARRDISQSMFDREYGAQFESDSDGYFRASKIMDCSVEDTKDGPCLEMRGEPGSKYIIGIDQSLSGSEGSDHFAMCVMKLIKRESDGKEIGMVVHSYAVAGGRLQDHTLYLYHILKSFNVVYIILDATQGDELEFVNSSNQSKLFQDDHINLTSIEADFSKDDYGEVPKQIKKSYNQSAGRILHKQPFTPAFIKRANEYLQASFDHRWIKFAGKIAAHSNAATAAMNIDISRLATHEQFLPKDMNMNNYIDYQDRLLDLTRKECAMIQVKATEGGTLQFGLSQSAKRTSGPTKNRKDSYAALLLCNWAVKMYVESQQVEIQTGPVDFPYMML